MSSKCKNIFLLPGYGGNDAVGRPMGKLTDLHMFDRVLTVNEMIGMTTCGGTKLMGNIFNTTSPYSLHGPHVEEIDIHEEEICPVRNFSAIFFNQWHWSTWTGQEICKKIDLEVAFVADESDKENILWYYRNIAPGFASWIQTLLIKREDGSWVNMNTNETTILQWGENHPIKETYGRMVIGPEQNNIFIEAQGTNHWEPVLCTADVQKNYQNDAFVNANYPYRLFVNILGLCSSSVFDYRYVFDMQDNYVYAGRKGSEIRFIEDGNWRFTSQTFMKFNSLEYPVYATKIAASHHSLALGTYDVTFADDVCTKGKENKVVKITITACKDTEFTCFDGNCVAMDHRCDRIVDCPDSSDEKGCRITQIDRTTYIQEYPPIRANDERSPIQIPIDISVDILKILKIDEVAGIFKVSFELHSSWLDPRLTYVNLKNNTDLNTLTEKEKIEVWSPNIVFANTESQRKVVIDRDVIAKIERLGSFEASSRSEAIRSYYFNGEVNPLTFSRIYDIEFICSYDMAWYPFDLQRCELLFKPFGNSGEYVCFVNKYINYFDNIDLSKYYIKQWKFYSVETDTGTGVEGGHFYLTLPYSTIYIPFSLHLPWEKTAQHPHHSLHPFYASQHYWTHHYLLQTLLF